MSNLIEKLFMLNWNYQTTKKGEGGCFSLSSSSIKLNSPKGRTYIPTYCDKLIINVC